MFLSTRVPFYKKILVNRHNTNHWNGSNLGFFLWEFFLNTSILLPFIYIYIYIFTRTNVHLHVLLYHRCAWKTVWWCRCVDLFDSWHICLIIGMAVIRHKVDHLQSVMWYIKWKLVPWQPTRKCADENYNVVYIGRVIAKVRENWLAL